MKYHPDVETFGLRPIIMLASGGVFCYFAAITLSLRVYARIYLTKAFGKDDWVLLLAFVSQIQVHPVIGTHSPLTTHLPGCLRSELRRLPKNGRNRNNPRRCKAG